jgi:hypothetical protein
VSTFELSPGIVVDTDRSEAYVMSPAGGIVALDLAQGTPMWHSREAAKPLTVSGDLLVSQAEPVQSDQALRIVSLNTRAGGASVAKAEVPLPSGVQPMIERAAHSAFNTFAQPIADDAAISWEFVQEPLRGIPPGAMEVLPGEEVPPQAYAMPLEADVIPTVAEEPGGGPTIVRATVRLNPVDGTVTAVEAAHETAAAAAVLADSAPTTVPGIPEPQFLSADGRHVMSSERTDESAWDKYVWTIFERESANRLGQIRAHVSYAPFFVTDSRVVYQTDPYALRIGDNLVEEPLQIRAVDLQTGERLWSQPVRNTTDRTPPPP